MSSFQNISVTYDLATGSSDLRCEPNKSATIYTQPLYRWQLNSFSNDSTQLTSPLRLHVLGNSLYDTSVRGACVTLGLVWRRRICYFLHTAVSQRQEFRWTGHGSPVPGLRCRDSFLFLATVTLTHAPGVLCRCLAPNMLRCLFSKHWSFMQVQ